MIGEQACFWNQGRDQRKMGNLLGHAVLQEYDGKKEKEPIPTLEQLKRVDERHAQWGAIDPCLLMGIGEYKRDWIEDNHKWMMDHSDRLIDNKNQDAATQKQMMHYKKRLDQGLHPPIWIMEDSGAEKVEWALCMGPNHEQLIQFFSSFYDLEGGGSVENDFTFCFPCKENECQSSSVAKFLVNFACTPESLLDPTPTLCVAIWLMRRGIAPFTRPDIDWMELVDNDDDSHQPFLKDAVSSPLFGPADLDRFLF